MEIIKSYAKVNLSLLVCNKKGNLHPIKSIFCLYKDLYDEIEIKESEITSIKYLDKNNNQLNIENCIITKTLNFLKTNYLINGNYEIIVHKNIPMGSGLGGGSSNAATIIKYILRDKKELLKKVIKQSYLIGSDVPFFLTNYEIATVENYGEKVRKLNIKVPTFKIYLNNEKCSTKDVYNEFDKLEHQQNLFILQKHFLEKKQYEKLVNDLEKPCFMLYKNLYNIRNELSESYIVKLSGSGSSFILFDKKENKNE